MTDTTADPGIKVCCATFYQSDLVRMLLGLIFHLVREVLDLAVSTVETAIRRC